MISEYKTVFNIEREQGYAEGMQDGEQRGKRQTLLLVLKKYLPERFPRIPQTAMNRILSITGADALTSAFELASSAASLSDFKKNVRELLSTN